MTKSRKRSRVAALSPDERGKGSAPTEACSVGAIRAPQWVYVLFWVAIALAAVSRLPTLRAPVALDDFAQRAMIEGKLTPHRMPWNLYDFVDKDNHLNLVDRGVVPWWSDAPAHKARFLRPLPSLLVWLDFRLAGYDGFLPHLHSLLWWALAVFGVHAFFRRLFGVRVGLFCAAVFAVSPAHTVPIFWLANRNVLVTTAIGIWALSYYVRWREHSRPRDGALTCALWVATMLTGEYALCFVGYVIAIELLRRRESISHRLKAIAPFALPLIAYLGIRAVLGYDIRQSAFYKNPMEDPGAYLRGAPRALMVLLGSGWFGFEDLTLMSVSVERLAIVGIGLALIVIVVFWKTARSLKNEDRKHASWLFVGSVLALAPVLSPRASMRLLGPAVIGVAGCVGLLMSATVGTWGTKVRRKRAERATPRTGAWVLGLAFVYIHFIKIPGLAYDFTKQAAAAEPEFDRRLDWVRNHMPPAVSTILVLRGETPPTAIVAPFMLRDRAPARWRVLSQALGQVVLVRSGPSSLEVTQDGNEPLIHFGTGDVLRAMPLSAGETIHVPGMRATIVALDDEQLPKQIHLEFDRDLSDPSFWSIAEGASGFRDIKLPAVGFGVRLPP